VSAGEVTGIAHSIALSAAGGARAAGGRAIGKEFSHWIPDRILKRFGNSWLRNVFGRSRLNGNWVSAARHYFSDPFRFPAGWRTLGAKWHPIMQQLYRIPRLPLGILVGAGYGFGSAALNK